MSFQGSQEWQYLRVPITGKSATKQIKEIGTNFTPAWRREIFGRISHFASRAPFYGETLDWLDTTLQDEDRNLAIFLTGTIRAVRDYLGIETPVLTEEEAGLSLSRKLEAGTWALEVCRQMKAETYVNPESGAHLFSEPAFAQAGVRLDFHNSYEVAYEQSVHPFVPDLSIIDTLMWLGKQGTRKYLESILETQARS